MEDIYGNLDNYEEEKIVQELKNENKELKNKLEEYACTLNNLQKEFDKLSAEYKKLEFNYSSLLKTAKAEIERKTSIITQLNVEKDQLVLNALQKRGRIPPFHNKTHEKENNPETEKHLHKQDSEKEINIAHLQTPSTEKCESKKKNDEWENKHDKIQSVSASAIQKEKESIPKAIEDFRDREKNKSGTKECKEAQEKPTSTQEKQNQYTENTKNTANRIRQRRKSMPLLKHGDLRFSSDEEEEENTGNPLSNDYRYRRKSPLRSFIPNDRRHDREGNAGRYESRDSAYRLNEFSRNNEEYSNYRESQRDNYFRNQNRYNDSDNYKSRDTRDRYETRYSKRFSPNRSRYNNREYPHDQQYRSDYGRQRVTVSSPPEKNRRRSREIDRYRLQNEETHSYKHKIHDQFGGPAHKRLRTESPQRRSEEHVHLQNTIGFEEPLKPQVSPYLSLQSPDYCGFNTHTPTIVKEIKGTANTKLEDPRLKSNKYVVDKIGDKIVVSAVAGRNVNIKCVDQTTWKLDEKIPMPTPLKQRPQVNEILEIHDPKSNLSLESGEVLCSEDDIPPIPLGLADISPHGSTNVLSTKTLTKYDQGDVTKIPNQYQSEINKLQATASSSDIVKKWKIPKVRTSSTDRLLTDATTDNSHTLLKTDNLGKLCRNKTITEERREVENVTQYKKHETDNLNKHCQNKVTHGEKNKFDTTTIRSVKEESATNIQREHTKTQTKNLNKEIYKDTQIEQIKDDGSKLCQNKNSKEEKKDAKKNTQWSLVDESLISQGNEDEEYNFSVQCQKNSVKEDTDKDSLKRSHKNTHKEDKKEDFIEVKVKDKGSQEKNYKEKKRDADKVTRKSLGDDKNTDNKDLRKRGFEKKSKEEKRDSDKNTHSESEIENLTSSTSKRHSKNKSKNKVSKTESLTEKAMMSTRDTVEVDLELSDETSDCAESVDPTRYVNEKYVQSAECIKEPLIVRIPTEKLREVQNPSSAGILDSFKSESEKIGKKKKVCSEVPFKESLMNLHEEQTATKDNKNVKDDMKAKLCYLFGDSSSLITPDDLGIVDPLPAVNIENKYSPMFDNTQDALDLNVEEMEKVQSRSSKTSCDETAQNISPEIKGEKKLKSKSHKSSNDRKRKAKNSESSSGTDHNIENLKEVSNKDSEIIKTVIISSGIQNQMEPVPDRGQELLLTSVKSNNNLPSAPSLPNLRALATSTPHKISEPFAPVSEASCSKNNTIQTNEVSNANSTLDSRSSQNNLDVPDVRIVVKRRRKGKAPN